MIRKDVKRNYVTLQEEIDPIYGITLYVFTQYALTYFIRKETRMAEHDYTLGMLAQKWEKGEIAEKDVLLQALMWMQSLVTNQALTEKSLERLKREVSEFKEQEG